MWTAVDEVLFAEQDYGRYKFLVLPGGGSPIAWGVTLETTGAIAAPRLRTGFVVPFLGVADRQVFGPSEAVFRSLLGQPLAIHLVGYEWATAYSGLTGRATGYGVACAPDRGAFPSVLTLWRLT